MSKVLIGSIMTAGCAGFAAGGAVANHGPVWVALATYGSVMCFFATLRLVLREAANG